MILHCWVGGWLPEFASVRLAPARQHSDGEMAVTTHARNLWAPAAFWCLLEGISISSVHPTLMASMAMANQADWEATDG